MKFRKPRNPSVFVIAGRLQHLTRAEAREQVELAGGRVDSTVSDATDYVVVGRQPGGAVEQARRRGLTCLDETQFLKLVGRTR